MAAVVTLALAFPTQFIHGAERTEIAQQIIMLLYLHTENGKTILPPFLALPLQRVEEAYALFPPRSQIDDR